MGHVDPEQDFYYDSEDFNDDDDEAPVSKRGKNNDGDWKAAKKPKKPVGGGSSGRGRGRPRVNPVSKYFSCLHIFCLFVCYQGGDYTLATLSVKT